MHSGEITSVANAITSQKDPHCGHTSIQLSIRKPIQKEFVCLCYASNLVIAFTHPDVASEITYMSKSQEDAKA